MALDSSIYKALVQVAVAQGWAIGASDIDQEQSSQTDVSVIARRNDGSVLKRIALDEVRASWA